MAEVAEAELCVRRLNVISVTLVVAACLSVAETAEKETAGRALYAPHHGCARPAPGRDKTVILIKSQ